MSSSVLRQPVSVTNEALTNSISAIPAPPPRGRLRRGSSSKETMDRQPAVYILASKRNGRLYIGVTSDVHKRAWEHKYALVGDFAKRYRVHLRCMPASPVSAKSLDPGCRERLPARQCAVLPGESRYCMGTDER
ncbi:MAG: GIY-YIG nuclease family protein [Gammaproteobacteria bacterium]